MCVYIKNIILIHFYINNLLTNKINDNRSSYFTKISFSKLDKLICNFLYILIELYWINDIMITNRNLSIYNVSYEIQIRVY